MVLHETIDIYACTLIERERERERERESLIRHFFRKIV